MKLITRDTDYALRAICFIAQDKDKLFSVSSLVKKLKIPGPFLRKLLQILRNKGVLSSSKGKGGGFSLSKNPKDILLWDIMKIFQGKFRLNECFLQRKICPNIKSCALRKKIIKIEAIVVKKLKEISIDSLLNSQKRR